MPRYSTFYTNFPVFSLVLDQDIKADTALFYPDLYKDLCKGRSLSYKTFFLWFLVSVYQGAPLLCQPPVPTMQWVGLQGR